MYTIILVVHLVVSFLLIGAVLIQSGKGSSMANVFGGGGMENVFGAETPIIFNRITTALAVIFMITCILLTTLPGRLTTGSILQREMQKHQTAPAPSGPVTPGPGTH